MSVTRSSLIGGPCYATFNSKTIAFLGDVKLDAPPTWTDIDSALYGKIDKVYTDLVLKASGTPLFYDTAQNTTLFPYIAAAIGSQYPASSDLAAALVSSNGDTFTLTSGLIGKMPDLTLGVDGAVMGGLEIWGVIGNTTDPSATTAYLTKSTGNSYTNPAVPGTAVLGRQEFTAAWTGITGFTSFQAQDKWTISHELELVAIKMQGRTRAYRLKSYRAMAKCIPVGPTAAQIDANLYAQGTGSFGGYRMSTNAANLVITGSQNMTVTIGNAGMVGEGFVFGAVPLRQGEVGWISNLSITSGGVPSQAPLTLS